MPTPDTTTLLRSADAFHAAALRMVEHQTERLEHILGTLEATTARTLPPDTIRQVPVTPRMERVPTCPMEALGDAVWRHGEVLGMVESVAWRLDGLAVHNNLRTGD